MSRSFLLIGVLPLLGEPDEVGEFKQTILPEWRSGRHVEAACQLAAHVLEQTRWLLSQVLQPGFLLIQRFGGAVQRPQCRGIVHQAQHDLHQCGR